MRSHESVLDISILIVSWNTRALTQACLDSIPGSVATGTTVETIVVDNGSTDGSLDMLRARDDLELVENERNLGYAEAVNQAFARSSAPLVLLLNSDVDLEPGSIQALIRFLAKRPEVAGVGPLYLNPDGSFQQHHYRLPTLPMLLASASAPLRRLPPLARSFNRYRMLDVEFSRPLRVEQPSASCLLLRRSVLTDGYLLDEHFPIYFNDVELAHRLATRGHELWMTPESRVVHVHGASTRQLGSNLRPQHLGSLVRYLKRTRSHGSLFVFRVAILAHATGLRAFRRGGSTPPMRDVMRALRGKLGPLPQGPRG
jgi:GT2 family glycosyltransferase